MMAIVKVRTNGDYVDLIDSALLLQSSVNEQAHSEGGQFPEAIAEAITNGSYVA